MTPALPRQRRRCRTYPWCTGHCAPGETEHHGRSAVVHAQGGRELRMAMTAVGDGMPCVTVEVLLAEGGPPLEVVQLDPVALLQAAAALRRLAVESQERV